MHRMLVEFCGFYMQDHDLIYKRDTDPIDDFCGQHSIQEQKEALVQLKHFHKAVLSGSKSIDDLLNMGLGYIPSDDPDPAIWLPPLIEYLEGKITNSGSDDGGQLRGD